MTVSPEAPGREAADDRSPAARLLSALHEVRVLWREVTRLSFPGGVSGLGVLHLVDQEGAVRVSDLAACGHVGVSTMSRQVAELTAAGLVERDLAPGDARAHLVRLTEAGRAELTRARTAVLERLAPALDGWTEPELTALESQLTRLTHDLAALSGRAPERI